MSEHYLQKVFSVAREWWGIDLAVLAHEGLLFDYKGDRDRAEELAALAPSMLRSALRASYVVLGQNGDAVFVYSENGFTLALKGSRVAIGAYLEPLLRSIARNSVKCRRCGRELDLENTKCSKCGAVYPFTLANCPSCGYTSIHRTCPGCGKAIDYRGRIIEREKLPLVLFSGIGIAIAILSMLIEPRNIVLGLSGALALIAVGAGLWALAPVYRYKE